MLFSSDSFLGFGVLLLVRVYIIILHAVQLLPSVDLGYISFCHHTYILAFALHEKS